MARTNDLGRDPVGPLVFRLAIPSMLAQFVNVLYSIVDRMYIGNIPVIGDAALAGAGVCGPIVTLVSSFAFLVGVGGAPLMAMSMGAGDRERARKILSNCAMMLTVLAVVLTIVLLLTKDAMLMAFGASEETFVYADSYLTIYVLGTAFAILSVGLNQLIICLGLSGIGMTTVLIGAALNIALDPVFIFLLGLEVRGAAIATVLGTVVACGMSLRSALHRDHFISLRRRIRISFDRETLRAIMNIGSSTLAEQMFLRIGFLTYSIIVANLGTTAFAAHQVGMNIMSISFSFGDGLSVASVALVGRSLGEKRRDLARIYGGICQKVGVFFSAVLSVIYLVFSRQIFLLFSDETDILSYGDMIMRLMVVVVFLQISQVVFTGCLRGAGDAKYTALVSLISVAFVRPFSGWLLCYPLGLGLFGAWLGLATDQLVRFLMTYIRFRKGKWVNLKI